jgi:hypothetical protein
VGENAAAPDMVKVAGTELQIFITPRDDVGALIFWPIRTDFNVTIERIGAPEDTYSTFPEHTLNGYHTAASPPRIMVVRRALQVRNLHMFAGHQ